MQLEHLVEGLAAAAEHASQRKGELALPAPFDQLAVEQPVADPPVVGAGSDGAKPRAKMGGDGIEVGPIAVAGEGGDTVGHQTELEIMQ